MTQYGCEQVSAKDRSPAVYFTMRSKQYSRFLHALLAYFALHLADVKVEQAGTCCRQINK